MSYGLFHPRITQLVILKKQIQILSMQSIYKEMDIQEIRTLKRLIRYRRRGLRGMCTTEQNYDFCGVEQVPTDESSVDSFAPEIRSRILIAPSLNAILKGTLAPVENLEAIEHGIWYPDTPETFLQASLQFLENKLHSRIYQMSPSPSGKVILSDGFIFSPIYPTNCQESSPAWDECVVKIHNFSEGEASGAWNDPKRVKSVVYSCVSIPDEHGVKSKRDEQTSSALESSSVNWEAQRDIGIQTSDELFTPVTETSSLFSDDEVQPISNFSEYVQYCHSLVRPPSQLFNFGESTQKQISDNKVPEIMPPLNDCTTTSDYPYQSIENDTECLPNSARTYASHYRTCDSHQERDRHSQTIDTPYEAALVRRQSGPCSKVASSTTTVSTTKSFISNRSGNSVYEKYNTEVASSVGSTKSVYYYARISASFFAFLNRATQKKCGKDSRPSSILPKACSATPSAISITKQKGFDLTSSGEDEKEGKLTSAKLNVLRRFMNFFGGAKSTKEYEKIKEPSAAIIDVTTGFFDDDNIFEPELKQPPTANNENKFKCNSFSASERHSAPKRTPNVASDRAVKKKVSNLFLKTGRKEQAKPKLTRHSQRDSTRDTDHSSSRTTTIQDFVNQQKYIESAQPNLVKKPSPVVSSIFGSKTSYSKTVCKDILKLRFEGDRNPVTATDTSHDENDCCMCYKPPQCSQTVLCNAHNDYSLYARIPENQRTTGNYRVQQNLQKEQQEKNSIRNFFKSRNDENKYSTCSNCSNCSKKELIPGLNAHGKQVLKPKTTVNNQYRPNLEGYERQKQDLISIKRPFVIDKSSTDCNSRPNTPIMRKPNPYLIEKPQVNPSRITRLLPDDRPKVWSGGSRRESFAPSKNNIYTESSDINSSFSTNNVESTEGISSFTNTPTVTTKPCTGSSEVNSNVSITANAISKNMFGMQSSQKYKHPSFENAIQNTASTSSSEFEGTTSYINNTVSNSSRSSYWLPPKRLARDSREFPKFNPTNTFQVKPTFSKEVIKLFQRAPKTFKK